MDSQTVAAYDLDIEKNAIVVQASFILENTGYIDTTVEVYAEGKSFFGTSDKKSILVKAKRITTVVKNFQFNYYSLPSEVKEINETITWNCSADLMTKESINVKLYFYYVPTEMPMVW